FRGGGFGMGQPGLTTGDQQQERGGETRVSAEGDGAGQDCFFVYTRGRAPIRRELVPPARLYAGLFAPRSGLNMIDRCISAICLTKRDVSSIRSGKAFVLRLYLLIRLHVHDRLRPLLSLT